MEMMLRCIAKQAELQDLAPTAAAPHPNAHTPLGGPARLQTDKASHPNCHHPSHPLKILLALSLPLGARRMGPYAAGRVTMLSQVSTHQSNLYRPHTPTLHGR